MNTTTAKGILTKHEPMRASGWQTGMSGDMQGKTLGIIGLGRLGGKLAGYDPLPVNWSTRDLGIPLK